MEERGDAETGIFDKMALYRIDEIDRFARSPVVVGGATLGAVRVAGIADLADAVFKDLRCLFRREIVAFQDRRLGIGHGSYLRGLFLQRHAAEQVADTIFYWRLGIAIHFPCGCLSHRRDRHGQSRGSDEHAPRKGQPVSQEILRYQMRQSLAWTSIDLRRTAERDIK